jgi:FkbM family methyltransferase
MADDSRGAEPGSPSARPPALRCKLPNGQTIRCQNKSEALFVYKEIFEEQVYLRHGITINDGDCVFDVGANIGLFTLYVQQLRQGVISHAFEPSPDLCAIARENTAAFGDQVHIHQCGISDEEREATFTFYPNYSILSTFHADDSRETEMLRTALRNQYRGEFADDSGLEDRHLDALIGDMLGKKRTVPCRLRPLSSIIRETGTSSIGLLKIDAERSELQALNGIDHDDWGKIRQIELEVHDGHGDTLPKIEALLAARGFKTVAEAEQQFQGTGVFNVWAVRA